MASSFTSDDELRDATFTYVDLAGARFTECDLSGVVMRAVEVDGMEIDAPWLLEGGSLVVNGVDVTAHVDAELDRRFPGRSLRHAADPAALREAHAAVERQWEATLARAAELPEGALDERVDGEWSFAETLRHLVMATDAWLGRTVLGLEHPFHPAGLPFAEAEDEGLDLSVFTNPHPSYAEVLAARQDRLAMVRDFLSDVDEEQLAGVRRDPWRPEREVTVVYCLQVILREEWEHHRFAVRDLEVLRARGVGVGA